MSTSSESLTAFNDSHFTNPDSEAEIDIESVNDFQTDVQVGLTVEPFVDEGFVKVGLTVS